MEFNREKFVERLASAKARSGKTDEELAVKCELPEDIFSHYMDGSAIPTAANLLRLCIGLDVGADWLIGLKEIRDAEE